MYKCEHCGSRYKTQDNFGEIRYIEVQQARCEKLQAQIQVPFYARDYMAKEDITKYTIRELTNQLAEGLAAYMRLDVNEDPCRMATIVRGTVRVVPPDFMF